MKVKLKIETINLIIVSAVSLLIMIGLIIACILINLNVGKGSKTIRLEIQYADKTYTYDNLKTDHTYLIDFLQEYDQKLALDCEYRKVGEENQLVSVKDTSMDILRRYYYHCSVNQNQANALDEQTIEDGDTVRLYYSVGEGGASGKILAPGGNNKLTYYQKLIILIAFLCGALLLFYALYLISYLIKSMKLRHSLHGKK